MVVFALIYIPLHYIRDFTATSKSNVLQLCYPCSAKLYVL